MRFWVNQMQTVKQVEKQRAFEDKMAVVINWIWDDKSQL